MNGHAELGFSALGHSSDPFALADTIILLPTRRAVRALRAAFSEVSGGKALLLPRMAVLGDADDDPDLAFDLSPLTAEPGLQTEAIAPAISEADRLFVLARLVERWRQAQTGWGDGDGVSSAEALSLAGELAKFIDQVAIDNTSYDLLVDLVPEDLAGHWQATLQFLSIVTELWPTYLRERGLLDPVDRRERIIRRTAERLAREQPTRLILAAGSAGSSAATRDLLNVIANLPNGCVILPGLDQSLPAEAWQAIGACDGTDPAQLQSHPQHQMKRFLVRLAGTAVDDLRRDTPSLGARPDPLAVRQHLVSVALAPAPSTAQWRDMMSDLGANQVQTALAGVSLVVANSEREEALVVATLLREALEDPNLRVAAVTPDRALARRIAVELKRWKIEADDSAGQPLATTEPGGLALLAALHFVDPSDPIALLSLLKHPLCTLGRPRLDLLRATRTIEVEALRVSPLAITSTIPAEHLKSLLAADEGNEARRTDLLAAIAVLDDVSAAFAPLQLVTQSETTHSAADLIQAFVPCYQALRSVPEDVELGDPLPADNALIDLFTELAGTKADGLAFEGKDLAALLSHFLSKRTVTKPLTSSHRVSIWGSLEARLQTVDMVVLAGLNEGTWPGSSSLGPFLSRPMRKDMQLSAPERLIGLAAHDFEQLMGTPKVVLSRAKRHDAAPSVASRFLQRLTALIGADAMRDLVRRGNETLALVRRLDAHIGPLEKTERPQPTPPVSLRPVKLSVTEIETWVRDPYAIYAKHILRLTPLNDIRGLPGPPERGILYHDILQRFFERPRRVFDHAALDELLEIGRDAFAAMPGAEDFRANLWPRFERIAASMIEREAHQGDVVDRLTERKGSLTLNAGNSAFELAGRADRIDRLSGGQVAILDYKTGTPPSAKEVDALIAPQLPLEALMVREGAMEGLEPSSTNMFSYIRLSGAVPPLSETTLPTKNTKPPMDLADEARKQLVDLINRYRFQATGYLSRARPQRVRYAGPYDHLARVAEWQLDAGSESDE